MGHQGGGVGAGGVGGAAGGPQQLMAPQQGGQYMPQPYRGRGQFVPQGAGAGGMPPRFQQYPKREYQQQGVTHYGQQALQHQQQQQQQAGQQTKPPKDDGNKYAPSATVTSSLVQYTPANSPTIAAVAAAAAAAAGRAAAAAVAPAPGAAYMYDAAGVLTTAAAPGTNPYANQFSMPATYYAQHHQFTQAVAGPGPAPGQAIE
ncbi:GD14121 [Drosophila simulans]|uniref:GD14121 n=2 Tax=Drosophila simulans TaxID=7240 RepID=B4NVQ4_DROSI|nr:GD14121 [Drosophila simulans]